MNSHPNHNGEVSLYYDGNKKLETTNHGVVITGVATATSFVGNLTGDVTGTATTALNAGGNLQNQINAKASTGKSIAMAMIFG